MKKISAYLPIIFLATSILCMEKSSRNSALSTNSHNEIHYSQLPADPNNRTIYASGMELQPNIEYTIKNGLPHFIYVTIKNNNRNIFWEGLLAPEEKKLISHLRESINVTATHKGRFYDRNPNLSPNEKAKYGEAILIRGRIEPIVNSEYLFKYKNGYLDIYKS